MMNEINSFLTGGQVFFSAVANPYSAQATNDLSGSTSSKKSDDGLLSKTIMDQLQQKGIPVDVDMFFGQLSEFEKRLDLGLPVDKKALNSLKSYANQIIRLSEYLKDAEERAEKNNAFGEIAITSQGYLFTPDKDGKIQKVHITLFDSSKQQALTVSELINQRKFNPSLVNNSDIAATISQSIGMDKINEYIQGIIKTVGSTETSTEAYTDLAGYVGQMAKRPTQNNLETIQLLYNLGQNVGFDAIFKRKDLMLQRNVLEALLYIQSMLPKNMLMLLLGNWVAEGYDIHDAANNITGVIGQALTANDIIKSQHTIDYEASMNKAAGTSAGTKEQNRNLKVLELLIQGSLGKIDYNLVSSKNPSIGMTLHGNTVGALTNFDNNIVPKAPMSIALESSIGPLIDKNHITMGSQKISESLFDTILYDGNDVINVWAPTDLNGDIDLSGMKLFNDLLEHFELDPSLSTADKNSLLQLYGIDGRIDDSGQFIGGKNMSQFLVFTGITSDSVIQENDDFVDKLSRDLKKYELELIDRIYGYLNGKNKNKKGLLEFKTGLFSTDILKAPVFMKLKPTALVQVGTFSNHGPLVSTPTYQDLVAIDLMRYNQSRSQELIYNPSTSLLFE